ncbi:hypothetical protein L3X07_14530 [Levilactobacillus brevis]|nr:hypothetical protein [Levilactobacillus brevis]
MRKNCEEGSNFIYASGKNWRGIDGSEILTYEGIPTICIGIPVRYEHTNYGMVAYQDFADTVKLVEEIITGLSSEKLRAF